MAIAFTYPLIRHIGSYVYADPEDGAMSVWCVWWMKYSLLDLGQSPLATTNLFYPGGTSLVFHSMPKALGVVSIPLQYIFGLATSYNLLILMTFVGTALATYWLAYQVLHNRIAAFMAGMIFAFSPVRWGQISHLTLLCTMLIPVYIGCLFKAKQGLEQGLRSAWAYFAAAGLSLGVIAYDTEHYSIFLVVFSALFIIFWFPYRLQKEKLRQWVKLAAGVAAAAAMSVAIYAPMLLAARREIDAAGDYVTFPLRDTWFGADIYSFITPVNPKSLFGHLFSIKDFHFLISEDAYIGIIPLLLALVGAILYFKHRSMWLWLISAVLFTSLALGPYLLVNGEMKQIAGTYFLFKSIPLLGSIRVPSRFVIMSSLSVAILAGYAVKAFTGLQGRRHMRIPVLIGSAFLLAILAYDFLPTARMTAIAAPQVYERIAAGGVQGSVVSLPLGWESAKGWAGREKTYVQLYQPVHKMPLVGGMVARAPSEKYILKGLTPVLDYLSNPVDLKPSDLDRDEQAIARVMEEYQISYIVIHKKSPPLRYENLEPFQEDEYNAKTLEELDLYITGYLGMKKIEDNDEVTAYSTK